MTVQAPAANPPAKVPNAALTLPEKVAALDKFILSKLDRFGEVLPKGSLTPEKFAKTILYAAQRTPKLLNCTRQSLFLAALQAADLGLPVGTGLAYLIPYANKDKSTPGNPVVEAQFQPDYKGLIALSLATGDAKKVDLEAVYEKDDFEIVLGTDGAHLRHRPHWKGPRGAAVAYYAIVTFGDGATQFLMMTRDQVEQVRKQYAQDESPAWAKSYDEMAKKTVFKRLWKTMRRIGNDARERLGRAIEHDNRAEAGEAPDFTDVVDVSGEVIEPAPAPAKQITEGAPGEKVPTTAERAKVEVAAKAAALQNEKAVTL